VLVLAHLLKDGLGHLRSDDSDELSFVRDIKRIEPKDLTCALDRVAHGGGEDLAGVRAAVHAGEALVRVRLRRRFVKRQHDASPHEQLAFPARQSKTYDDGLPRRKIRGRRNTNAAATQIARTSRQYQFVSRDDNRHRKINAGPDEPPIARGVFLAAH